MGGQTDGVDLVGGGERLKPLVLNMEHGDVVGNELTVQFSSGNVIVRVSNDLLDLEDTRTTLYVVPPQCRCWCPPHSTNCVAVNKQISVILKSEGVI